MPRIKLIGRVDDSEVREEDRFRHPTLLRAEVIEEPESPRWGFLPEIEAYQDEIIGGSVWEGILEREEIYWNSVINGDIRVDQTDPVGGLIDITDQVVQLGEMFANSITMGYHIDSQVTDYQHRIMAQHHRSIPDFFKDIDQLLEYPKNMTAAGSHPLSVIIGSLSQDVDIFFPAANISERRLQEITREQVMSAAGKDGYHTLSEHAITTTIRYGKWRGTLPRGNGNLQLILRKYHSVTEVLMGFDIGACGVAIYKNRLYATERAIYEIVNQVIMISMSRASTTYIKRLIKYTRRGFRLHVEGISIFRIPSDNFYRDKNNMRDLSSLEYLYGMITYSRTLTSKYDTIRRNLRQASDQFIKDNSDYGGGDWIRGPNYLIYGNKQNKGYYICKGGKEVEINSPILLKDLKFLTIKPYRQGSLSHCPLEINLRDWAGIRWVIYGQPTEASSVDESDLIPLRDLVNNLLTLNCVDLPEAIKSLRDKLTLMIEGHQA